MNKKNKYVEFKIQYTKEQLENNYINIFFIYISNVFLLYICFCILLFNLVDIRESVGFELLGKIFFIFLITTSSAFFMAIPIHKIFISFESKFKLFIFKKYLKEKKRND